MEEKKEIEIKGEAPRFNERIRSAQNFYLSKNWRAFKKIFEGDTELELLKDFDLFGNTAINIAARSNYPLLLRDLLEMVPEEHRWNAFRRKNKEGNTLLHEIALQEAVEMVDVVFEFEKKAPPPPPRPGEEEEEGEKRAPLLEIENQKSETPLFRAAKYGKLKMFKQMVKHADGRDMKIHLHSHSENILHACVNGHFFDVAIWIMTRMDGTGSTLAEETNDKGLTCLQLLSRMPHAFRSHYPMGSSKKLLYYLLPEEGYEIQRYDRHKRDLESGRQDDATPPTSDPSRISYGFWKYLAKVFRGIDNLWKEKKKHKSAKRLAELLVKNDYSWQKSNEGHRKTSVVLPPVLYNVPERKKRLEQKKQHLLDKAVEEGDGPAKDKYYRFTPLLVAASYGIIEIVELFLKEHPQAIHHVSEDKQNVLHIAVKHRQLEIFKLLKKHVEFDALTSQICEDNRTILHQVARTDYYRPPALAGAAFQLQHELKWYKRVEKVIRSHLIMHCDKEYLTAGDVLDIAHDDMLRDAQSWIKETSQSCSTVAVLVATVVFAAAYTIPGGTEAGTPVLLRSSVFLFFTTMDIVALALSLASVVVFLSILTSPFELWDFHRSLPRRLRVGFAFLFCSLTTTMLAFIATILLTIRLQWKHWTSTLIYGAAFFPVTIFALIEFPLYKSLPALLIKMCKNLMKMVLIDRVITLSCFRRRIEKTKYP